LFLWASAAGKPAAALRFAARDRSAPPQAAGLRANARTAPHR
jgi:hypothetical protein